MTTAAVSSTPDRDGVLALADGRRLAVAIWGEDGDRPVVLATATRDRG